MNVTAWENVKAAVAASSKRTIKELFAEDPGRVARYTA